MMFGWIYFAHGDTIATSVPVSLLLHCQCLTSLNQLSCSLGTVEIMPEIEADMTWINNMICHVYMIGVCLYVRVGAFAKTFASHVYHRFTFHEKRKIQ